MEILSGGTVTSPRGFLAGATSAGIKKSGGLDLGMLCAEGPCTSAGLFTTSRVKAAPVLWSQQHVASGKARAVIVNSGCANACTGDKGLDDAAAMASLAANRLGVDTGDVLVASTGMIGHRLPVERIWSSVGRIVLSAQGGHQLAQAIMTTDTRTKEVAVAAGGFTIGGIAKGSGMIHPDMGTLLVLLATDAAVEAPLLREALRGAVDASFNMVTIDGDTSPNDAVFLLASGKEATVEPGSKAHESFTSALTLACTHLARCVAADGEGATRLLEVVVEGASSVEGARAAARAIAGSPLVKAAVHGCDPNWGRIIAALGRSGAEFDQSQVDLFISGIRLVAGGSCDSYDEQQVSAAMKTDEVPIRVCLNGGQCAATAWGCDLSAGYVSINSEYST